jgi:chitinase
VSRLPSRNSISDPNLTTPSDEGYKLVCYYTNWSQYRPKKGKYLPEDIDPFLCTHLIFAFGWIKDGRLSSFEANDVSGNGKLGLYQRVVGLKAKNPKLKVMLAIGGWSFGTSKFKEVAETRFTRQTFIFSAIPFLRKHNFDGLDVDWEYPKSSDKENFVAYLKELRLAFEAEAQENGGSRLLLSAAVPVGPDNVRGGYDVPNVSKYLDFINLMAYDFHGKWEKQTGHNAPLYAPSSDSEWRKQLSVSFAAKMWTRLGTPKDKLVIGMPTYGRSFTLADASQYVVNSLATDGGTAGEYTREAGFLAYYEVCDMLIDGASYVWDEEMKVPYLVKGDQWVGFDDERSIRGKMDWIKTSGYAGAMVWTVDMDDFNGTVCGSGVKYPLIGAMREELLGLPREVVAPGIEPADIDWASVTTTLSHLQAATLPPPTSIDLQTLLSQTNTNQGLPALLQQKLPDNTRPARVFCYYTNWSYRRPGMGQFTPEDVDPTMCTHIFFAFATIKDNKIAASEDNDVGDAFTEGTYDRIMRLKELNPKLKVILAVGGWAFGSEPFRALTENVFRMNGFVYDAIGFLREHGFDGLDIDWEYPRGPDDRAAFVSLVKELRLAFEGEAESSDKDKLLLTAAVPASFEAISAGYDVPELSKYLDYINVMTYDFHGQWENRVGHNSPLFPLNSASSFQKKLTVDYSAKEWVRQGAPLEKLIIGMPVYGRTFNLADPAKFDVGAEATGGGEAGRYTGEAGFLSYYEICDFLHQSNTTLVWDNEQQVPFAYRDDQWVGFDDERSLRTKVAWLKAEGFGGIMIWSVDLDDFRGYCGTGKFPLTKAMVKELEGHNVELKYSGPYETPDSGSPKKKKVKQLCTDEEHQVSFHRDRNDCKKYFVCQGTVQHHKSCPDGLVFNEDEGVCDWPTAVEACANLVAA